MSEFKGTEGKWLFKYVNGFIKIISEENGVDVLDTYNNQKDEYNALVMSKSREMLEMLNNIKEQLNDDDKWSVEQLIKEVTEL